MKTIQALLELFAASVFFLGGLFFLVLPFQEPLRLRLAHALIQEPELFRGVGAALLGVALLVVIGFYRAHRRRFFVLRMGDRHIAVDPLVVSQTLRPVLVERFPGKLALKSVEITPKGLLEIQVVFAEPAYALQTLQQLEHVLQPLFAKQFGYRRPFNLVVAEI